MTYGCFIRTKTRHTYHVEDLRWITPLKAICGSPVKFRKDYRKKDPTHEGS